VLRKIAVPVSFLFSVLILFFLMQVTELNLAQVNRRGTFVKKLMSFEVLFFKHR
jgi:hypothetical protein